jgi:tetratricopeptide (TPR) repeat protein
MLSQTQTEVIAYPQLEVKLAQLDRDVKNTPDNPALLTERGDYLLDKGDLAGAIDDFRKALANKPDEAIKSKARGKLYEAFTEHFQRDFAKAEGYLKEYEEMCKIDLEGKAGAERAALDQEMRRRRANFLCLVGKGREAQGRLVEAFEKYLELGAEARKDELIQVVDEPSVKAAPDVWSQGRIAAMIKNTTDAKQKKALEDLISDRWAKLKETKGNSLDDLRKFVALFGSLFGVGKEARLSLAERLMTDPDINSMLEAEQQLTLLRGDESPQIAARAIEALARLNEGKGRLEDAAYYYRLLGEQYPKIEVEGKKGSEYLDDLATDKRFLPYLDNSARFSLKGKVKLESTEERKYQPALATAYQFAHSGEGLPFFVRNKLSIELNAQQNLRLVDVSTGEERWKLRPPTPTQFQQIANANGQGHRVRFGYQSMGHLVVVQIGHMVLGLDPMGKGRILWEKNLSSLPGGAPLPTEYVFDAKDNTIRVLYSDGWVQRLGQTGPLAAGVVCLQMRDNLTAVDPITGRTLWTRTDVNSRTKVFGDEQHVFVVNLNEKNEAAGTRVFRAYDGVSVKVPDFSTVFDRRTRIVGRTILATSQDARNATTYQLYDILEGREIWKQTFEANAIPLTTLDDRLIGAVESGTVRVIDVATRKENFTAKLDDAAHAAGATAIHLLGDAENFYLAINGPADPNVPGAFGGVQHNVDPTSGLRAVPVNGMVYAWDKATRSRLWLAPVLNQQLVVSQFEELPMLLFTSRYQHQSGQAINRMNTLKHAVRALAKHNGKTWFAARLVEGSNDGSPDDAINYATGYFHTLNVDVRSNKVEFIAHQFKVTMTATPK